MFFVFCFLFRSLLVLSKKEQCLVAELAPSHVHSVWGSRGERVRAAGLAACCNYFSKKKKKKKKNNAFPPKKRKKKKEQCWFTPFSQ